MKKFAAFLAATCAMSLANAQAIDKQSSWYTEGALDLQSWGAHSNGLGGTHSPKSIRMVIGKRIMPSVSVEATAGFGLGKSGSPSSSELKIKSVFGLYGKYTYELLPKLDVYGKIGFTMTTSETNNAGAKADPSDPKKVVAATVNNSARGTGMSFGFGANYDLSDKFYVGADYTFLPKAPSTHYLKDAGVSAITFFGGMRY